MALRKNKSLSGKTRTFKGVAAGRNIKGKNVTPFDSVATENGDDMFEQQSSSSNSSTPDPGKETPAGDKGKLSEYFKSLGKNPEKTAVTRRMAREYRSEGYDVDVKKRGGLFLKIQGYKPFYDEGSSDTPSSEPAKMDAGIDTKAKSLSFTNPYSKYANPTNDALQQQAASNASAPVITTITPPTSKPKSGTSGGGKKKGGIAAQTGVPFIQKPFGPVDQNGEIKMSGPTVVTNQSTQKVKDKETSNVDYDKAFKFAKANKMNDYEASQFAAQAVAVKSYQENYSKYSDEQLFYENNSTFGFFAPVNRAALEKELKNRGHKSWDDLYNSFREKKYGKRVYVSGKGYMNEAQLNAEEEAIKKTKASIRIKP